MRKLGDAMGMMLTSVLLFGLIHPGAKFILDQAVPLVPFVFFGVLIRWIVQWPFLLKNHSLFTRSKAQWLSLITLGIAGTCLQISEFWGLVAGLPVSSVSFLVYTHPVWAVLFSVLLNKEPFNSQRLMRVAFGVFGAFLLSIHQFDLGFSLATLIPPMLAGLFIALWVSLSHRASDLGSSSIEISFFYDAFSLWCLGLILFLRPRPDEWSFMLNWLSYPSHFLQLSGFAIFTGLIPNWLFYEAGKHISAFRASLLLLLEPVISTIIAGVIWHETLSPFFAAGAFCLLMANFPARFFAAFHFPLRKNNPKPQTLAGILLLLSFPAFGKTLHVLEIVPAAPSDYTVSSELKQISTAVDLALTDVKPRCSLAVKKDLRMGTEDELIAEIKTISATPRDRFVIGLSRSNFARAAAKAASGTDLQGLSIGAATTQISSLNQNFASIVSPIQKQWHILSKAMAQGGCNANNTAGIFDASDHLSARYQTEFQAAGFLPEKTRANATCLFIGMSFAKAQDILTEIFSSPWRGKIYGVGDWNLYAKEVTALIAQQKSAVFIQVPTGWIPKTARSKAFAAKILAILNEPASPLAAYAYDAALIGAAALCEKRPHKNPKRFAHLPLLRRYEGISNTGNYLSQMELVTFANGVR